MNIDEVIEILEDRAFATLAEESTDWDLVEAVARALTVLRGVAAQRPVTYEIPDEDVPPPPDVAPWDLFPDGKVSRSSRSDPRGPMNEAP